LQNDPGAIRGKITPGICNIFWHSVLQAILQGLEYRIYNTVQTYYKIDLAKNTSQYNCEFFCYILFGFIYFYFSFWFYSIFVEIIFAIASQHWFFVPDAVG